MLFDDQSFNKQMMKTKRVALIGCSKTKVYRYERRRGGRAFPPETYGGQLFSQRVLNCENRGVPWCVLSAKLGVWRMDEELKPTDGLDESMTPKVYDTKIDDLSKAELAIWVSRAVLKVCYLLQEPWHADEMDELSPSELTIEIHAGKKYSTPISEALSVVGFKVELPTKGMPIDKQLQHYSSIFNDCKPK